jgi:hypothetical protein
VDGDGDLDVLSTLSFRFGVSWTPKTGQRNKLDF